MTMRQSIRFVRDGKAVELTDIGPNDTLLDYLRLTEESRGTKEGCAEGDCGACSVAVGAINKNGQLEYQAVNSCIQLLGMLDGKEIITVDDLSRGQEALHPVQDAMVRHHGSQCGFCTPGIVMSLFTLYHKGIKADRQAINNQLAGNLCRCTGYRPIIDAALESCNGSLDDRFVQAYAATTETLNKLDDGQDVFLGTPERFFAAPASIASLAKLYSQHPDAIVVAGATDVGLWITKQLRDLPKIIHLGRVEGLDRVEDNGAELLIGAGATYAQAEDALATIDPDIAEVVRRIGSSQVRASGTIGGNIANGSPIGDSPPLLIALDARLGLEKADSKREIRLEDFFIDYGKQDRQPGEFVSYVKVPKLAKNQFLRSYKISKRFDQDISALLAAFRLTVEHNRITEARIAFGGMAATPKRAAKTEKILVGLDLADQSGWTKAAETLEQDYQPISDMRASKEYRNDVAKGLLLKALHEISHAVSDTASPETRVIGQRNNSLREAV
ncbi:xanthine dehydrogenase small subunit [Kiloniella laminariae]|uniref:xanthine dehydrogenase small subunit n=1 Tax=Kiloniella laminariae TaxID=454162 RepID=UPI000367A3AE|nr:xanthine dehydrogenase small subunit [Kiloniella laminariae]